MIILGPETAEAGRASHTASVSCHPATSQFTASASHELRTSLMSIVGYAELLASGCFGELTPSQADAVTRIERNGERVRQLVDPLDRILVRESRTPEASVSTAPSRGDGGPTRHAEVA
jgi:signal transduction histidine kinase